MKKRMGRIWHTEIENKEYMQFPKFLLGEEFRELSNDAKVLYTILGDRLRLSNKNIEEGNGYWVDKEGHVFVYATQENIMKLLNCRKQKATKIKKELIEYDLIDDVRQGQGNPNKIYLKNLATVENTIMFENQTSECLKIKQQKVRKSNTNKNYINKNEINKNENTTTTRVENSPKMETKITSEVHGTEKASKMDTHSSRMDKKLARNKRHNYSTEQIKELQDKFKQITGYGAEKEYIIDVANECGIDNLEKTINRFNQFRPTGQVTNIHGIIRVATRREAKGNAYNNNLGLRAVEQEEQRQTIKKPSQSNNFEQREYSDEFFDSLYDNF